MPLILSFQGKTPRIAPSAFIAENATLIGDVEIGEEASVWFGCVLRADIGKIRIGARSNVQDLCCVHMTDGLSDTFVGEDVTVGHGVILHGCGVGDRALVGMGSILLDNSVLGEGSVLGAGSLLTPRSEIPAGHLALGRPARAQRPVTEAEARLGIEGARHYVEAARGYRGAAVDPGAR
jgi:carbonic anhydrase/acetyltransferase-like protein (isoleucine patch superfamily)